MQRHPELDRWILAAARVPGSRSLLDVACGVGRNGFLCWEDDDERQRFGVELDARYLRAARGLGLYDGLVRADLSDGIPFSSNAFDVVVCTDVVSQLDKGNAVRLVQECERVAASRVVLTVTLWQELSEHDRNPLESHRSTWTVAELRSLGYALTGFGWRSSRGIYGRRFLIRYYFGTLLSQATLRFSEEVLCVKELRSSSRPTGFLPT